jgi:hypothetical protein
MLLNDRIPMVEQRFRAVADRDNRAMTGLPGAGIGCSRSC